MGEVGKVIDIENNKLVVALERKEACAKCGACSAGMKSEEMLIRAINACDASLGDNVEIVLEEANFIKAVLIMYGFPFLLFLLGVFVGYYGSINMNMSNNEFWGFGIGMLFVVISYLIIRSQEKRWKKADYIPKAINIVK